MSLSVKVTDVLSEIADGSNAIMLRNLLPYLLEKEKKQALLSILDVGCSICTFLFFLKRFLKNEVASLVEINLFPLSSKVLEEPQTMSEFYARALIPW